MRIERERKKERKGKSKEESTMQHDQEPRHSLSSTLSAGSPSSSPRGSFSKNRLLSEYPHEGSSSSSPSPVSPTLPQFVSKDGRPSGTTTKKKQSRLLVKVLLLMCGLGLLGWLGVKTVYTGGGGGGGDVSEEKQQQQQQQQQQQMTGIELITPPEALSEPEAAVENIDDGEGEDDEKDVDKEVADDQKPFWEDYVPSEPAAVKLPPDTYGNTNWTVSIPEAFDFPLRATVYKDLCSQIHSVAEEILEINENASSPPSPSLSSPSSPSSSSSSSESESEPESAADAVDTRSKAKRHMHWEYYEHPSNFVEPQDAVDMGLLPDSQTLAVPKATFPGGRAGQAWTDFLEQGDRKTCNSSLVFLLQTESAGMGRTLMEMWLAYGLAKKEGRAFFIDDTRW